MRTYGYRLFLTMMILFLVSYATIWAEENEHKHTGLPIRCGTSLMMRKMLLSAGKYTADTRSYDTLTESVVSSHDHFRVHYNTTGVHAPDLTDLGNNGIPDYVDSVLVNLEYAWNLMINQLGYTEPLNDGGLGGGNELDVYLNDLGQMYGMAIKDNASNSAYLVIDNDFSEYLFASLKFHALRVTTAHVFFHTIHFRYYYTFALVWWMEQTAVWMEDVAWGYVDDFVAYLRFYFQDRDLALDNSYGSFKYGAAIWPFFLSKRFGNDIIRDIWQYLSESKRTDIGAFDIVLDWETGTGLSDALGEFAVWNYFTNDPQRGINRSNTIDFHSDSDIFENSVEIDLTISESPSNDILSAYRLTNRYVELNFNGDWSESDTIHIEVSSLNGGEFKNSLIFFNDPYDFRIHTMQSGNEYIPLDGNWEKAVLVTACTNTIGSDSFSYQLKTEKIGETVSVESGQPLSAFSIKGTYPNPFNPATTISFTMLEPDEVSVKAFNTLGQNVDDIFIGYLGIGEKHILWKPTTLSDGVYLINIANSRNSVTTKVLLLK